MVTPHPLCLLLPALTAAEYDALLASVRAQGLLRPITLYEGMILDGRHRYRACLEAQVTPTYETYTGANPAEHILGLHTHRALSVAQRALLADALLATEAQAAAQRQRMGKATNGRSDQTNGTLAQNCAKVEATNSLKNNESELTQRSKKAARAPKSSERAAAAGGISARSLESVHAIRDQLAPEIVALAGELSVAHLQHAAALPVSAQRDIAALATKAARRAALAKPIQDAPREPARSPEAQALEALRAELADVQEHLAAVSAERDALKLETEGKAAEEIQHLQKLLRVAEQSRDHYMQQTAALRREVKALRRKGG